MKNALSGLAWVVLHVFFAVAPLAIVALADPPHARPFLIEFSVALGFVGLAMMGLQFALVARFKTVAAPFGIDVCGSDPMMDAVEKLLLEIGVPASRLNTERFNFV